jgi:hypothetical protein
MTTNENGITWRALGLLAATTLAAASGAPPALASFESGPVVPIRGKALKLRDDSSAPANPEARRIAFRSGKHKSEPSGIVLPLPGTDGDPSAAGATGGGATLSVYNAAGSSEGAFVALPAEHWEALVTSAGVLERYRYHDSGREDGPIASLTIDAKGKLKLKGKGAAWPYTLDEPSQGAIAVRLQLGSGATWCALLEAKASGNPPSTAKHDRVDRFTGSPDSPPPAACPPLPVTLRSVAPEDTDPGIDLRAGDHVVAVPAPGARRGELLVFYPGTRARPDQYTSFVRRAAEQGYHAIGLDYENSMSINFDVCPGQPAGCHEAARLEILTGVESPYIEPDVDPTNAAFNRLARLLAHLAATYPDESWERYLAGGEPRWDRIVTGGHSQGGGHAAMTAKLHAVGRVLLFGATEPAPWTLEPFATPSGRFWGLAHQQEPIFNGISRSWDNIGLPGASVQVELAPPPSPSNRLVTTFPDCGGDPTSDGYYHNCYIVDGWMPPADADGAPTFAPLWDYMLTATSALAVEPGDVAPLNPPGESWFDPEVLRSDGESLIAWQDAAGGVWVAEIDPRTGLVVAGSPSRLADGAAPLLRTFNGPEFGVDAAGWAVYYTRLVGGSQQVVRVRPDLSLDVLTAGDEHFSPLATIRAGADSTHLVLLRRPPEWGTLLWADAADTSVEHELLHLAERTDGDARWAVGTATLVTNAHPDHPGQLTLVDTDVPAVVRVTDEAGLKTTPYAWAAPEAGGRLLVLAVVDHAELVVWGEDETGAWQRLMSLPSPSPSHPYLGSPEPFVAGGRSYVSLSAADAPDTVPGSTSQEVWIVGIDPAEPFARRCDDSAAGAVTRADPEILLGAEQAFVYYNVYGAGGADVARCATGIRS